MGERRSEGKDNLVHTVGKDPGVLLKEETGNDGKFRSQTDADTENLSASFGRTIHLGNFEFARVNCGIKAGLLYPVEQEQREATYKRMHDAIEEVLDREEAFIRGQDREFKPIDLTDLGVQLSIWVDYGMTFKNKGMDSNKVDVSASRRLADGSDFETQLTILSEEVGERIGAYKARVLGTDGDVGL